MAETMVTDPVYLDQTAKDNGRKLDQMTAALLGMSSSLGVIARAQTGVVEEMDYNGIKAVVAAGNAPAVFPVGTQLVNTYTGKDGKTYDCPWDVVQPDDIAEGETGTSNGAADALCVSGGYPVFCISGFLCGAGIRPCCRHLQHHF